MKALTEKIITMKIELLLAEFHGNHRDQTNLIFK